MGRPSSLTAEIQEQVVELLSKQGLFRKDVAARVGVAENTFSRWFTAGAHDDAEPLYRGFYIAVLDAEAQFKEDAHRKINLAGAHNPKLILSFLARRFPGQYGRKDNVDERSAEDRAADAEAVRETMIERVLKMKPEPDDVDDESESVDEE